MRSYELIAEAFAVSEDGTSHPLPFGATLERLAPGRFRAHAKTGGEPFVVVRARDASGGFVGEAIGRLDGGDELAVLGPDERALEDLARAGSGLLEPHWKLLHLGTTIFADRNSCVAVGATEDDRATHNSIQRVSSLVENDQAILAQLEGASIVKPDPGRAFRPGLDCIMEIESLVGVGRRPGKTPGRAPADGGFFVTQLADRGPTSRPGVEIQIDRQEITRDGGSA